MLSLTLLWALAASWWEPEPPAGQFPSFAMALPALPPPCCVLGPDPPLPRAPVSPVDTQPSYLFPFRSFGSRSPPGSRMPLQTKVR